MCILNELLLQINNTYKSYDNEKHGAFPNSRRFFKIALHDLI